MEEEQSPAGDAESAISSIEVSEIDAVPEVKTGGDRPPKKLSKKRLVLIVALVACLVGAGVAAWLVHRQSNPKNNTSGTRSGTASLPRDPNLFPRFDEVSAYSRFQNADWYAVQGGVIRIDDHGQPTIFTHKQGVPFDGLTSLAVYKNRLWIGSQGGIAVIKADGSGFESSSFTPPSDIQNGKLIYDKVADKLYFSTFHSFYQYIDATSKFEQVSVGIKDVGDWAVNANFLALTVYGPDGNIWVLNHKTGNWAQSTPPLEDQTQHVFALNGEVFVVGQTKGYPSCSSGSTIAASSVFRLDSSGIWQPLSAFNSDTTRPELELKPQVKDSQVVFDTSVCDGSTKPARVTATYDGNNLVLKTAEPQVQNSFAFIDGYEQQGLINEISSKLKLHAFTQIYSVDSDGNLVFSASDAPYGSSNPQSSSIYVASGTDTQDAVKIGLPVGADAYVPIMCTNSQSHSRKLSYVFLGQETGSEGGPTGLWSKATIYKINGTKATEVADLGTGVAAPVFSCADNLIHWMGQSNAMTLDTTTYKTTAFGTPIGAQLTAFDVQVIALQNGDLWVLLNNGNRTTSELYYVDGQKAAVNKLAGLDQAILQSGSQSYAWLSTNNSQNTITTMAAYNRQGSRVLSKEFKPNIDGSQVEAVATGDATALVFSNKSAPPFSQYDLTQLNANGASSPLDLSNTPIREMDAPNTIGDVFTIPYGVVDPSRKLVWISDAQFGAYTIPLP